MAFNAPISVRGLNEVIADFGRAGARALPEAAEVVEHYIGRVTSTAKTLAPRRTGATAQSIHDDVSVGGGRAIGESGPTTRQGFFMEYGTYKDPPQASMGPSLDRHSADFVQDLESMLDI